MRFIDLFEDVADNVTVFYGGRFQPMHVAHKQVYEHLVNRFGADNVFIATTFSQKAQKAHQKGDFTSDPFTFDEKETIMSTMHGIPRNRIVNTNPYRPDPRKVGRDPNNTAIVIVYSAKDAGRLSTGGALQPFPNDGKNLLPTTEVAAYVYVAPEMEGGMSATTFRETMFGDDEQKKKSTFQKFFGKFNQKIYDFIDNRLSKHADG